MKASELRKSILQAAVQGKLVSQNPQDEPASELFKRIQAEKEQLIQDKKLKKEKPLSAITEEEIPFELPQGWILCRLDEICNYIQRGKSPKYSDIKKIPVVAQKCNQWAGFDITKAKFIDPNTFTTYQEERHLQNLDLLWNSTGLGTVGRIVIYNIHLNPYGVAVADSHVSVVRPLHEYISAYYLLYFFTSPIVQSEIEEKTTGSTKQKELLISTVKNYLIPLPPLEEQKRIVAKVDELMLLCDELEKAEKTADNLDKNFFSNLPKSILQSAIKGELLPQCPTDEPASELFKRIQAEKEQLIKDKKLKKEKPLPAITEEEIPFELPQGWIWCRLGEVLSVSSGKNLTSQNMIADGNIPVYGGNGVTGYHNDSNVSKSTLVIGRVGYYCGSVHVTQEKAWVTDNAFIVSFTEKQLNVDFFKYLLIVLNLKEKSASTAQPVISGKIIYPSLFALPPLEEQKRIVAKVDELMALCEEFKAL